MLRARSAAEEHLYMDLHPCTCGSTGFDRRQRPVQQGDVRISRFSGPCHGCGTVRTFDFVMPESPRLVGDGLISFGGHSPSTIIDPWEYLTASERWSSDVPAGPHRLDPASRDRARYQLARTMAALEEVLKFIPPGGDAVPIDAFRTADGTRDYMTDPNRYSRHRLEGQLRSFRDLARQYDAGERSTPGLSTLDLIIPRETVEAAQAPPAPIAPAAPVPPPAPPPVAAPPAGKPRAVPPPIPLAARRPRHLPDFVDMLSRTLRVDAGSLSPALRVLGGREITQARVSVDLGLQRLGVLWPWPLDSRGQARLLAWHATNYGRRDGGQGQRLGALLERPSDDRYVELETVLGDRALTFIAHATGARRLREDAQLLGNGGVTPSALEDLLRRADQLAGGDGSGSGVSQGIADRHTPDAGSLWAVWLLGEPPPDGPAAALRRVRAQCDAFAITRAQRQLFEQAHPRLAPQDTFHVSLAATATTVMPYVRLHYRDVPWRTIAEVMRAFYPEATLTARLDEFAGAFGAERASAFELRLLPSDPPAARVTAEWHAT